jgi:hypothetical protein
MRNLKPRFLNRISYFLLAALMMVLIAACDPEIPDPPAVTVNVTVVDDTQALEQGIAEALAATQAAADAQTATVFAQGGVTYTPSPTLTPSFTPTASATRFVTATRTPPPSDTPTSTYVPYATNTPAPFVADVPSWIRILHTWRDITGLSDESGVDVYVNDERISRGLNLGEQTPYMQVIPGQVRITLRTLDSNPSTPAPLILNEVVNIPEGSTLSILLIDLGNGLTLFPVPEDLTPLTSNLSRLTIVQGNPELIPVNMTVSATQRSVASDFSVSEIIGPFDLPSTIYDIDLFDVKSSGVILDTLPTIELTPRLNYLLVLSPFRGEGQRFSTAFLFSGSTRLIQTDLNSRFINFASSAGPITITVDNQTLFSNLPVGSVSVPVPVSALGSNLLVQSSNGTILYQGVLGPWTDESERNADKIFVIGDNNDDTINDASVTDLSQNPPRSSINASIRLINALPGGLPLSLEIRRTADGEEAPWIPVAQASVGNASNYAARTPDTFDMRVVQAGTRTQLAVLPSVQLLAGAVYDFAVLPGTEAASARLELIQPSVQITSLATGAGDPTVIEEAVQATLRASVTDVSATPTNSNTSTPTLTPVSTNTPRPTNTPSVLFPSLIVDPAPPNTTTGVVTVIGQHFAPGRPYSIRMDNNPTDLANGVVNSDGTLGQVITLPVNIALGAHTIRVCVDCLAGGSAKQEQFAVVLLADDNLTPTATAQP